jgi:hypothetical protein
MYDKYVYSAVAHISGFQQLTIKFELQAQLEICSLLITLHYILIKKKAKVGRN